MTVSKTSLIEQALTECRVEPLDPIRSNIDLLADQSLAEFDERALWTDVKSKDTMAILLLLEEHVYRVRAQRLYDEYPVSGFEGSSSKQTVIDNCLRLADNLRRRYDSFVLNMDITVSDTTKVDILSDRRLPFSANVGPTSPDSITVVVEAAGTILVDWGEFQSSNFRRAAIYVVKSTDSNAIVDKYGNLGVKLGLLPTNYVYDKWLRYRRIEGLSAGSYKVAVVIEDYNAQTGPTEEVSVTVT